MLVFVEGAAWQTMQMASGDTALDEAEAWEAEHCARAPSSVATGSTIHVVQLATALTSVPAQVIIFMLCTLHGGS